MEEGDCYPTETHDRWDSYDKFALAFFAEQRYIRESSGYAIRRAKREWYP
jgi:hypothetical protein